MSHSSNREEEGGSENDKEHEVEKLVAHRKINKRGRPKYQYLIKWKNFSDQDNTWEIGKDIFNQELIEVYWQEQEEKVKEKHAVQTRKQSTLDNDNNKTTTTVFKFKQSRTLVNSLDSKRRKSRRQSAQRDNNDDLHPIVDYSSSSKDKEDNADLDDERDKGESPVIIGDISVKPPKDYEWTDAQVISDVFLDTNDNLLAKITWPNGEDTYSSTNLLRVTVPHLIIQYTKYVFVICYYVLAA
ncbi:hypothetical protein INT45_013318 [Circinella minor]|uniref:Chromo domain-containing protein n=1 Tax=Circinella minor TaxID=1195481 RepID=A0A8H7S2S1_9FUNG|nr:hypothetical protein INT45_013318 [Circinella minor]